MTEDENEKASGQPQLPERIGPYHVLGLLGEGGMGTVYVAEMRQPVRRRVALKVIKLGMDTKRVVARFEAERQALSMMEHTNIARVYECGSTEAGQPWFAMEYVKGVPITEYCDQNKLSVQERIGLFKKVCAGIQHAHLKGVMHRDVKPNNVLVMLQDDTAIPKIIDFGLAKAVEHRLVEATLFTEQGIVIGTPEYMSPEQAGLGGLDVDTRTDVYSLGVLLYELLTGQLPFQRSELRAAGLMEMQRVIREVDPPKPSTRITTLGRSASEIAKQRGTTHGELGRVLRGDLDWILMQALEKDPTRRYQSVADLSADLGRYLKFEPVLASPPDLGYRLVRFARRHRVQLAAAAVVLAALGAGLVATWIQYQRAQAYLEQARGKDSEAERLRGQAADARINAEQEREKAIKARIELEAEMRRATALAQQAEELRQDAAEARSAEHRERGRAEQSELVASSATERAQREEQRARQFHVQALPWRLCVTGPALLAAADESLRSLSVNDSSSLAAWITSNEVRLQGLSEQVQAARGRLREGIQTEAQDGQEAIAEEALILGRRLERLDQEIRDFRAKQVAMVRLVAEAGKRWELVGSTTRAADGVVASVLYDSRSSPYNPPEIGPVEGLIPLGVNPATGLWEFYHLPSASAGSSLQSVVDAPSAGSSAVRVSRTDVGIVFVLLPGGTATVGAMKGGKTVSLDEAPADDEMPRRQVRLAPFLIAKHELTWGQWARLGGDVSDSNGRAIRVKASIEEFVDQRGALPVCEIEWASGLALLTRHGMSYPTEAQWEFACRGDTSTSWYCDFDEIPRHENLSDLTTRQTRANWFIEPWSDGFPAHAPVGSFAPNPFGLHDMHGNVAEWCLEEFGSYDGAVFREKSGERAPGSASSGFRVYRGGAFNTRAQSARSSARHSAPVRAAHDFLGIRPVMLLKSKPR